jgi:sugar lactone lactonase YvrE
LLIKENQLTFIIYINFCFIIAQNYIQNIAVNAKWIQNGIIVAGGNGQGNEVNQLSCPNGLYVADDETIYVADYYNHRIVEWKNGATGGRVVAGGNGQGNRNDQLNGPINVIVDNESDSLMICDYNNKRVVRWPRQNGTSGEIIISDIYCWGLTIDNDGCLYVSDYSKHEIRRWMVADSNGILVAGGNGQGNRLDQLSNPTFIFVDQDHAVYVTDGNNHRVMKWMKGAKEGIVVAGGQDAGNGVTQLNYPRGLSIDQLGTIYVADYVNHRVMRWLKGATQGAVIIGGNGRGLQPNQFSNPWGLSFDRHSNLYVADYGNHRIQKFDIESSSNSSC